MSKRPFPKIKLEDGRMAYVVHDPLLGEIIIPEDNPVIAKYHEVVVDRPVSYSNRYPENGC